MVTWRDLHSTYIDDSIEHWAVLQARGLDCPFEAFSQLFHEQTRTEAVPALTASLDWTQVRWSEAALSGEELRQVHIDRHFERAVDEATAATVRAGLSDARVSVVEEWRRRQTWIVPPILVTGAVIGNPCRYALLVGNTRLGNLFGLLERGEVAGSRRHRVWIGRLLEPPAT